MYYPGQSESRSSLFEDQLNKSYLPIENESNAVLPETKQFISFKAVKNVEISLNTKNSFKEFEDVTAFANNLRLLDGLSLSQGQRKRYRLHRCDDTNELYITGINPRADIYCWGKGGYLSSSSPREQIE